MGGPTLIGQLQTKARPHRSRGQATIWHQPQMAGNIRLSLFPSLLCAHQPQPQPRSPISLSPLAGHTQHLRNSSIHSAILVQRHFTTITPSKFFETYTVKMSAPTTKTFGKATREVPAAANKASKWYPAEDEAVHKKVRFEKRRFEAKLRWLRMEEYDERSYATRRRYWETIWQHKQRASYFEIRNNRGQNWICSEAQLLTFIL